MAQVFTIKGRWDYRTVFYDEVRLFSFSVSNEMWMLSSETVSYRPTANTTSKFADATGVKSVISSDGIEIFEVFTPPTSSMSSASIRGGRTPIGFSDYRAAVVWYVYSSRELLSGTNTGFVFPPFTSLHETNSIYKRSVRAFWTSKPQHQGGFLQSIDFLPYYLHYDELGFDRQRIPAFAQMTNMALKVVQYTNVGGLAFPAEAILQVSACSNGWNLKSAYKQAILTLVATNILLTANEAIFKPSLPGRVVMMDFRPLRFKDVQIVPSQVTNWPGEKDSIIKFDAAASARMRALAQEEYRRSIFRYCFIFLFALILLAPLVSVLWRVRQKHKTTSNL